MPNPMFGHGKNLAKTHEKYIKALTDISRAITSEEYLENILKLIVMVTAMLDQGLV